MRSHLKTWRNPGRERLPEITEDNDMPTQDAPVFLIRKLSGIVLLIVGGLLAAYGVRNGATSMTVFGGVLVVCGVIVLALKIARRNQDDGR